MTTELLKDGPMGYAKLVTLSGCSAQTDCVSSYRVAYLHVFTRLSTGMTIHVWLCDTTDRSHALPQLRCPAQQCQQATICTQIFAGDAAQASFAASCRAAN